MIVHFRIAIALIVCVVVSSPVVAQENPKIFLGASSKTLGHCMQTRFISNFSCRNVRFHIVGT